LVFQYVEYSLLKLHLRIQGSVTSGHTQLSKADDVAFLAILHMHEP
jgi:hypothetical protein